jgi:polysaccharide export outer membrane protein
MINVYSILISLVIFTSCITRKDIVYFQDGKEIESEIKNYSPKIKSDDFLSILVFNGDEVNNQQFNLPVITASQATSRGYFTGTPSNNGYLVDSKGFIDLPIIGEIRASDLTKEELTLALKLKYAEYITNPKVTIQIQNFKITVLGDVKNPGTIQVPNERITVLEAIGVAGDLNLTAVRKNIVVIRDENGIKKEFRIDLTSKDFFNSPVYYLNQNDVVYVEPNKAKINSANFSSAAGLFISVSSLIITTINVLTK